MVKVSENMGYVFFFWIDEIGGRGLTEPPHIHVNYAIPRAHATKFWLDPVEMANNNSRIPDFELRKIERYIRDNQDFFLKKWEKYFE